MALFPLDAVATRAARASRKRISCDERAICGLVDGFRDRLPDDVFDKLMIYMRDIRYTLLRRKIVADQSYTASARCFLRLIEDRKRQCDPSE